MATTNSAFVKLTAAQLVGSTVQAAGAVVALNESNATQVVNGGSGTRLDAFVANLATAGYAKNGAASVSLTGTTPVTLDLTTLSTNATASAGDLTYATFYQLVYRNTGAADVTVAPGGSNPASLGFGGTTPTITVPANSAVTFQYAAGVTVDSTHKTITITPTSGGSFALCVGGA